MLKLFYQKNIALSILFDDFFRSSRCRILGNRPAGGCSAVRWKSSICGFGIARQFFLFFSLDNRFRLCNHIPIMNKGIGSTRSTAPLGAGSLYFFFYRAVPAAH